MNKKIFNKFLFCIITLILCLMLTSCNTFNLLKKVTVNEVQNQYIEYSQNITVEDIEDALISGSEIAKSSSIGVLVKNKNLLGIITESGSGVIIKRIQNYDNTYKYLAVTNRHVTGTKINGSLSVYLGEYGYVDANLENYSLQYDLALISFNTGILLNVATINEEKINCGQFSIAVGSPYDLENYYNTVTVGSISSTERIHSEEDAYGKIVQNTYIQHNAAINAGNSGGGLFDINGHLIGINTWKLVGDNSDHIEGINFAIPVSNVLEAFSSYLK